MLSEEEKQERADNCTEEQFHELLRESISALMKVYSIITRIDPSARKRINMDGRNRAAVELVSQYANSIRVEILAS
jgi:hypothetical protein